MGFQRSRAQNKGTFIAILTLSKTVEKNLRWSNADPIFDHRHPRVKKMTMKTVFFNPQTWKWLKTVQSLRVKTSNTGGKILL